jgi:hypothetical protein
MELFSHKKTENFFWQLDMFDVCTTGATVHIDTIFNDPKARIIAAVKNLDALVVHTLNISSCQKILFQFSCGCEHLH